MSKTEKNSSENSRSAQNKDTLETKTTYQVDGKAFVVTPVFQKEGSETLGSVLVKLMQSELHYEH